MLIDDFLPDYDVRERHRTEVYASLDEVYAAVRRLDLSHAKLTRWLFRLRGIPCSAQFSLDNFLSMRFILLGEKPNEELLLGLVGRFWTLTGQLRRLNSEGFRNFKERGYAKAAWNFSLSAKPNETVLLETETRVYCLDESSRRRFRFYWLFIGAFSKLVRREILQSIKRDAERLHSRAA
jgi:hypothetical protein